jgi:hypothetical protein
VQTVSTPRELFSLLQEHRCFEENEYVFIQFQEIFKQIKRPDLVHIVSDYCESNGKGLYIKRNKGTFCSLGIIDFEDSK